MKTGDKVQTIHGEHLTVLDVRTTDQVTKKGKVIQKEQTWILAESGGHKTWFPSSKLK